MKNKKQRQVEERSVPELEVVSMDDLAVMTDDVLIERFRSLDSMRESLNKTDAQPWEVEIAYVRRELQLRRTRHQLHEEYLKNLDIEANEALELENQYPVADLDNSAFMFFN